MAMCDLSSPHFHDEEKAREHLENVRWPDGPICPHCGCVGRIYPIKARKERKIRAGLYKCGDCDGQFTVTVGTVFERSKVPLNKWLAANHMMCASKKGCSAKQLQRMLGVTYKTAWFMAHRIREAMRETNPEPMGGDGQTVEVDETFWGNRKPRGQRKGRGYEHKEKILSLVERAGRARSFHVPSVNAQTLRPIIKEQIKAEWSVMTDEAGVYVQANPPLSADFAEHGYVSHGIGEYVRGDIHTNTIENYFSVLKRGMTGVYQHCGKQHLKRYLCEFDFRYNHREKLGYDDLARAAMALRGIEGKRLMYRDSSVAMA
jgi:transposase-like protein